MNDVNFSECKFSSDIVPYMYGEMSGSDASSFESHLLECSKCTDEFASISSARYEVYDWKKLQFDPLATPVIKIAFEPEPTASWIGQVSAMFAQGWAIPSLAAAGVFVVAIVAASFILSEKSSPDIAANFSKDIVVDQQSVTSAPAVTSPEANTGDDRAVERETEKSVIKSVTPQRILQKRTSRSARSFDVKATSAQNQQRAPRLNEFVEEEDTSVRLAELFDDIETSE
jgi:hypothetical protein